VIPRSYLFVPATRSDRIAKAVASGADAVIVDLEDAVAPADKTLAREALAGWFAAAPPDAAIYVRTNAADTRWFADDLALCRTAGKKLAGIVLPKAERIEQLARAAAVAPVLPLIETAQGFAHLHKLAYANRVQRLLFGSIDFRVDLGIGDEREGLLYFRSELVLQSRLAELPPPVDGVTTTFDDPAPLESDTRYIKALGFGAKLCIHPKQFETVHRVFAPTQEEIAWARRVLQAAEAAQGAAVALDGRMIDRPVILSAQRIIDSSDRP
jgi:citrate lyase subunit beta/citryl-CoA lyase